MMEVIFKSRIKSARWQHRLGHPEHQRNLEMRPQVPTGRRMNAAFSFGWENCPPEAKAWDHSHGFSWEPNC